MSKQLRVALQGGGEEVTRRMAEEDRIARKMAWKPSSRQRALDSRKTLNVPLKPDQIYRGEELRKPR